MCSLLVSYHKLATLTAHAQDIMVICLNSLIVTSEGVFLPHASFYDIVYHVGVLTLIGLIIIVLHVAILSLSTSPLVGNIRILPTVLLDYVIINNTGDKIFAG